MEKRLPLALLLSFVFMVVYQMQFLPEEGSEPQGDGSTAVAGDTPDPSTAGGTPSAGPPVAPALAGDGAQPNGAAGPGTTPTTVPLAEQAPAREESLTAGVLETRWTSRGAALTDLALADHHPTQDSLEPLPLLAPMDDAAGSLLLRDVAGAYALDQVHWALTPDVSGGLVFEHVTADGLRFRRTVQPRSDQDYTLDVSLEVINEGGAATRPLSLVLQGARGLVSDGVGNRFYGQHNAVAVIQDDDGLHEVETWGPTDLADDARSVAEGERLLAAGTTSNYFGVFLTPTPETDVRQVFPSAVLDRFALERAVADELPADELAAQRWRDQLAPEHLTNPAVDLSLVVLPLQPGETSRFDFALFAGPKSAAVAEQPGFAFVADVIDAGYGNWSWINHGLLAILRFFQSIVGNWGVAIIMLTILVKGLTFPLNRRQQTSMSKYSAAMGKLKPRLDELKAKYKNNTRKYQEEQMKLLKQEGVTPPLGGCLLMFLQFPIWISLFQILGTSIELRQSAFFGWISDLSRPDQMPFGFFGFETINLLPILMAIATIVQMRFQPKPADESQAQTQKIMGLIMPVFMLWLLYQYSAGLSLYIFTSSLLGIFEFQVIRRIWPVEGGANPGRPHPANA